MNACGGGLHAAVFCAVPLRRAQAFTRRQSQMDRICTVEAVALFLREFGEGSEAVDGLLAYLHLNNQAQRPPPSSKTKRPKQGAES